jgi:hypothetical protein
MPNICQFIFSHLTSSYFPNRYRPHLITFHNKLHFTAAVGTSVWWLPSHSNLKLTSLAFWSQSQDVSKFQALCIICLVLYTVWWCVGRGAQWVRYVWWVAALHQWRIVHHTVQGLPQHHSQCTMHLCNGVQVLGIHIWQSATLNIWYYVLHN